MARWLPLVEELHSAFIFVLAEEDPLRSLQEPFKRTEGIVHTTGLIARVHHAVRALWITAFGAIVRPLHRLHQFLEAVRISVLQQIARLLPTEDAKRRHSPRSAGQIFLAHQELHKDGRSIEAPCLLAIREDRPKQLLRPRTPKKVLLVGSLVIGVSRRNHHALHTGHHQLIEVCAYAIRISTIKQCGVRSNAEARFYRNPDSLH